MTIGFKKNFPWGEPTNFREKILAGVKIVTPLDVVAANQIDPNNIHGFKPKLHTFRADPHDRWKAGRKIEMVYRGAGYKIIDHFNKGIPELEKCVSVQKIKIWYTEQWVEETIEEDSGMVHQIHCAVDDSGMVHQIHCAVDDRELNTIEFTQLAINDGFNDIFHFMGWFKKDWEGKVIHWSDLRY